MHNAILASAFLTNLGNQLKGVEDEILAEIGRDAHKEDHFLVYAGYSALRAKLRLTRTWSVLRILVCLLKRLDSTWRMSVNMLRWMSLFSPWCMLLAMRRGCLSGTLDSATLWTNDMAELAVYQKIRGLVGFPSSLHLMVNKRMTPQFFSFKL